MSFDASGVHSTIEQDVFSCLRDCSEESKFTIGTVVGTGPVRYLGCLSLTGVLDQNWSTGLYDCPSEYTESEPIGFICGYNYVDKNY